MAKISLLLLSFIIHYNIMATDKKFFHVAVTDTINTSLDSVWNILAKEFLQIHKYSEFVTHVDPVNDKPVGLGCQRKCTLKDGGFMEEEIAIWEANRKLEIVIKNSSMPMVPGTSVLFEIEEANGKVQITANGKYRLKFLGGLSPIIAKGKYKKLLQHLIDVVKEAT